MKKGITKILAISGVVLLMLASCKKNDVLVKTNTSDAGTLTASSTSLVLNKSQNSDTSAVVNFSFTAPKFGFKAAVTNTLQIDSVGDNWAKPVSVTLGTNVLTQSFTTSSLNAMLLKLVPFGKASQVNVRMQQALSTTVTNYSNVVTLTVTPYSLAANIYVAGAYEGWSVPSPGLDSLVSQTANGIYVGFVNFTPGNLDFKLLPENKDYNGNYGSGATAGTITNATANPPNITAPSAAYYQVTVNTNNNTISYLGQWSIIGDASPGLWSTDTNMNIDPVTGNYYTTVVLISDGTQAIKFRYLNAWDINLGGANGTLTQGGPNITIPKTAAGGDTYKITLNPTADTYTLVKQ
jgi:hypothetical protein